MKEYNTNNYKLIYDEKDPYKDHIINELNSRLEEFMNFFKIEKLEQQIVIKIYYSIDDFKEYIIPYLRDKTYYDWMIGSTHDGNINQLSLECCRTTQTHKDRTLKQYLDGIIHEVVHKLHHTIKGNNKSKHTWFHEALATNLSKQDYEECEIDCTLDELINDFINVKNKYRISYTLGKYLLDNYSNEFIISMCKNETILDEFAPKLFKEVKEKN